MAWWRSPHRSTRSARWPTARDCADPARRDRRRRSNDSTSAPQPLADYEAALTGDLRGLRVGVRSEYFIEGTQPGVDAAVRGRSPRCATAAPDRRNIAAAYQICAAGLLHHRAGRASSNLARYDGVRYGLRVDESYWGELEKTRGAGFGPRCAGGLCWDTRSAGYYDAYYKRAQQVRTLIRRDFQQAFERVDIIAAPTAPTVAFKIGEKTDDPLAMYLEDVFTLPGSLAGVPGLVAPCGFSEGLPVGLQLIGRPFDEATLLRAGDAYQRVTDWQPSGPAGTRS